MTVSTESQDRADNQRDAALHYHLNGMFVVPEARCMGVARALISHVLQQAQHHCEALGQDLVCTLIVDEMNTAAYQLYLSCGFAVVESMTYAKKIVQDGVVSHEDQVAVTLALRRGHPGDRGL